MSASSDTPRSTRWWVLIAVSVALFIAVYVLMVLTPLGQAFENTGLRGADQVAATDVDEANETLGLITIWSLGIATLVVAIVGLARRQLLLAVLAVGVIVGGQIVTQSLKRFILPRPELIEVVGDFKGPSFPSGHTTIAMTVLVAVFLVVPYRARGIVMFFVVPWAAGIGAYTLIAKWHRLSDTIGADLVALALGSLAAILLLRAGRIERAPKLRVPALRTILVVGLAGLTTLFALIGALLAAASLRMDLRDPVNEWNVYLAVTTLATAGSLLTALVYWGSWRRLDVKPAAVRTAVTADA
ncbi:MAG: phosphatase PAP2 family protein [Leucobacter sp.]|nr:phosphatase PAP2 family protein [Leucobacter sp.]